MPQVFHRVRAQRALLSLGIVLLSSQLLEDKTNMLIMLLNCFAEDKNIIQIYHNKLPKHVPESITHQPLKRCRSIAQPKWKYNILIQASRCEECSPMDVGWVYLYLVVGTRQIQTREHLGLCQLVKQISNPRNGENIRDGVVVQHAVIYTHPQFTSLLANKQDWRSIGTNTRSNPSLCE